MSKNVCCCVFKITCKCTFFFFKWKSECIKMPREIESALGNTIQTLFMHRNGHVQWPAVCWFEFPLHHLVLTWAFILGKTFHHKVCIYTPGYHWQVSSHCEKVSMMVLAFRSRPPEGEGMPHSHDKEIIFYIKLYYILLFLYFPSFELTVCLIDKNVLLTLLGVRTLSNICFQPVLCILSFVHLFPNLNKNQYLRRQANVAWYHILLQC